MRKAKYMKQNKKNVIEPVVQKQSHIYIYRIICIQYLTLVVNDEEKKRRYIIGIIKLQYIIAKQLRI